MPALTKRAAIDPPEDSLLPTTPTGWYLHYHYIATGPKPYGTRRINRSATDKSAYGQAVARVLPELQGAINRLEQGNLTLVDPETLDVFFSLEQSSVLGTNLVNGPYAASKMSKLVAEPAQFAERGRLQSGRFRGVLPVTWRPESLCRHARLRRSAHDRDHGAPTADRADQQGPVGQSAMGGGGSGEDRRGLPARPRSDDADRFALPDRGSGGVPRDIAAIDPHESHRRHRRQARHDDPDSSRWSTRPPGRRFGARRA